MTIHGHSSDKELSRPLTLTYAWGSTCTSSALRFSALKIQHILGSYQFGGSYPTTGDYMKKHRLRRVNAVPFKDEVFTLSGHSFMSLRY